MVTDKQREEAREAERYLHRVRRQEELSRYNWRVAKWAAQFLVVAAVVGAILVLLLSRCT